MTNIFISHRGNINGPDKSRENSIQYIREAIKKGYDVEIDVWFKDGNFYLGHDTPDYITTAEFLKNNHLWCHAKNYEALSNMIEQDIHCFWHETDKITITSKGFLWAYPGNQPLEGSIAVMPEIHDDDISVSLGVCSDFIERYKTK